MALIKVAIIGGGPAGLVTLKTLLEASTPSCPIEATIFEAEADIGGTFKYRSYDNAELVSSKQLTAFSDYRFPLDASDHVSLPQYVNYLEDYVKHFKLAAHIKLRSRVTQISPLHIPNANMKHQVTYLSENSATAEGLGEERYECSHVAICTGLHVQPNIPLIPGIKNIDGPVFHSSTYQSRSQLANHDILILGCGETAMDIAYEAIKANARSITMCFRTGFLSFPKALNRFQVFGYPFMGRMPIDGLITNLFETAYVHHSIRKSRLRSLVSDAVLKKVMWFLTGTQEGCNQHVGVLPPEILGRSYVFLNKSHKAMPYLNRPYKKPQYLLEAIGNKYMDLPEDADSEQIIDTCTWPHCIDKDGRVIFEENVNRKDWRRLKDIVVRPTCVIQCTGYKQDFNWLHSSYPSADQANVRNVVKSNRSDIAFIGFVRPNVGAIPPIAEQQAMWWTALILGIMDMPTKPGHYKLLTPRGNPRIKYGVDHSSYMSTLARDFGGAPRIYELWCQCGPEVVFAYCFGASFVTFYRLLGPFAKENAVQITKTELMETITRRGIIGNFFFAVVPMLFYGTINALAYLLETFAVIPKEKDTPTVDF